VSELDAEDAKLVTLARSARARADAAEGAAVRDDAGRTYAAATVSLPSLELTALQAAIVAAVSSGSTKFEAAVVLGDADAVPDSDRKLLADIGNPTLHLAAPDGTVRS
jgi:cytidine deaminase